MMTTAFIGSEPTGWSRFKGEEPYIQGLPAAEVAKIYKITEDLVTARRV